MNRSSGFALFTALILLLVLTLVAIVALRSSGLELQMGSNETLRAESFESSDSSRLLVSELVDVHTFNRGWPDDPPFIAGDVPKDLFGYKISRNLTLEAISGKPRDWFVDNSEPGATCDWAFCPGPLDRDATYSRDLGSTSAPYKVRSTAAVFKVRTDISPGAGAAMVAGYEGMGRAVASSGGRVFFYVQSKGNESETQPGTVESETETGTMYRHVIRN